MQYVLAEIGQGTMNNGESKRWEKIQTGNGGSKSWEDVEMGGKI